MLEQTSLMSPRQESTSTAHDPATPTATSAARRWQPRTLQGLPPSCAPKTQRGPLTKSQSGFVPAPTTSTAAAKMTSLAQDASTPTPRSLLIPRQPPPHSIAAPSLKSLKPNVKHWSPSTTAQTATTGQLTPTGYKQTPPALGTASPAPQTTSYKSNLIATI